MKHSIWVLAAFFVGAAHAGAIESGVQLYQQGDVTRAIHRFESAVAQQPNNAQAWVWLAKSLQKQGTAKDRARAIAAYRKALSLAPQNPEALTGLGQLLSWSSATRPEAIELLQRAVTVQPQSVPTRKALFEVLAWSGQWSQAVQVGEPILSTLKSDRKALGLYAEALTQSGSPDEAVILYESVLKPLSGKDFGPKVSYAYALVQAGHQQKARELLSTLVAEVPPSAFGHRSQLSGVAYALGDYASSFETDKQLPAVFQKDPVVRLRMARAAIKTGNTQPGLDRFEALYQEGLRDPDFLLEYGDVLLKAQPSGRVEALYKEALTIQPGNAQIWVRLGRLLVTDRYPEAIEAYQKAASLEPRLLPELLDVLKSDKDHAATTRQAFESLMAQYPTNPRVGGSYGQYLSYEEPTRAEAIRLLAGLTEDSPEWEETLAQTLAWHQANLQLLPVYEGLIARHASGSDVHKWAQLSVARAFAKAKTEPQASNAFAQVRTAYPQDAVVRREWAAYIIGTEEGREKALPVLKQMAQANPNDSDLQLTYARLLSYEGQYGSAIKAFNALLRTQPRHKDALTGKAQTLLWANRNLEAKKVLRQARELYPQDQTVTLLLIETERAIGRYDRAIELMREVDDQKRLNALPQGTFRLVSGTHTPQAAVVFDASPMPIDDLQASIEDIQAIQEKTDLLLQSLQLAPVSETETITIQDNADSWSAPYMKQPALGSTLAPINPLSEPYEPLKGQGFPEAMNDIERAIIRDLRPAFRVGYGFFDQDGEDTTQRLRSFGVPNQLTLALSPQLRVRAGISPWRLYLPESSVTPRSTWATEYSFGATAKYWDRVTLMGDMAITNFTQSNTTNITYFTQADVDVTDRFRVKLGSRRYPLANSLLSYAGLRPDRGAFGGQLLGQARENTLFLELNANPLPFWDVNAGYEWGWVEGSRIPDNFKNQAFFSTGLTHRFGDPLSVRLGYQFLYFGYAKNTMNGFFDTTAAGINVPVSSLDPLVIADDGYDFGGYFSPESFFLNSIRLDLRGALFNRFLLYKIGGSLGVQAFSNGHGIQDSSPTTLASAFDASVLCNFTDWLAAYGNVDFLDAGGFFQRWRFGGGLVVRPNIPALSPVFRGRP